MATKEGTIPPIVEPPRAAANPAAEVGNVVVKKKKKRRYSRALKRVQRIERGLSKSNRRLARAIVSGIETWQKRRNKSARKRRDGALRDWIPNSIRAVNKAIRVASRAGDDFLDEVKPRFARWPVMPFFPYARWF